MFIAAGLSTDEIHNHSLRATGISRLYSKGFPEKVIMERSGHQSVGGIRSYERTTDLQKKAVSNVMVSNNVLKLLNSDKSCQRNVSGKSNLCVRAEGKENEAGKSIEFKDLQGCSFNFTFNHN